MTPSEPFKFCLVFDSLEVRDRRSYERVISFAQSIGDCQACSLSYYDFLYFVSVHLVVSDMEKERRTESVPRFRVPANPLR